MTITDINRYSSHLREIEAGLELSFEANDSSAESSPVPSKISLLRRLGDFAVDFSERSGVELLTAPSRYLAWADPAGAQVPLGELLDHRSDDFIQGMTRPFLHTCEDGVQHVGWVLRADPSRPKHAEPLVVAHAYSIVSRWGMGLETNARFHDAVTSEEHLSSDEGDPNRDIIILGNIGVDSGWAPSRWFRETTFIEQARNNLEMLRFIQEQSARRGYPLDFTEYVGVGESMGTILHFNMATVAAEFALRAKGLVMLAPAGLEPTEQSSLVEDFAIPEVISLLQGVFRTPLDKIPKYLQMLVHTGIIPPQAMAVLLKEAALIATHDLSVLMPGLQDTRLEIHGGTNDFVANPEHTNAIVTPHHPNSQVTAYSGERHMRLARVPLMASRLAESLAAIDSNRELEPASRFIQITAKRRSYKISA